MKTRNRSWHNSKMRALHLASVLTLSLGVIVSFAQQSNMSLPAVITAAVPFYPPAARAARIEGVVRMRISTDGKRVSFISAQTGPPALIKAAEENVRTWQFKKHNPTTFETTFRYKVLSESECKMDSGTVLLMLPTAVEVTAKGVRTCDPVLQQKSD